MQSIAEFHAASHALLQAEARLASSSPSARAAGGVGEHDAQAEDDSKTALIAAGLLQELLNSALLTASTASIWNWARTGNCNGRAMIGPALADHMPPLPVFYPEILASLLLEPRLAGCTQELRDYYDHLVFLRGLSLSTLAASDPCDLEESRAEALTCSWRRLAAAAATAIPALVPLVPTGIRDRLADKTRTLLDALEQAAAGGNPAVDRHGNVYAPLWMERRKPRRAAFDLQIHLLVGGAIQGVTVLDISEAGLGVADIENAEAGDAVDLILDAEHLIPGRVVWQADGRAGLEFFEPLPSGLMTMLTFANTDAE